jgi:hypothetical protein
MSIGNLKQLKKNNYAQHRIKLIASFSQFTKVQTNFLSLCFI